MTSNLIFDALPLFDKSDDIIGVVVILMTLGMIENLLMVFLQRDLQKESERKHTYLPRKVCLRESNCREVLCT